MTPNTCKRIVIYIGFALSLIWIVFLSSVVFTDICTRAAISESSYPVEYFESDEEGSNKAITPAAVKKHQLEKEQEYTDNTNNFYSAAALTIREKPNNNTRATEEESEEREGKEILKDESSINNDESSEETSSEFEQSDMLEPKKFETEAGAEEDTLKNPMSQHYHNSHKSLSNIQRSEISDKMEQLTEGEQNASFDSEEDQKPNKVSAAKPQHSESMGNGRNKLNSKDSTNSDANSTSTPSKIFKIASFIEDESPKKIRLEEKNENKNVSVNGRIDDDKADESEDLEPESKFNEDEEVKKGTNQTGDNNDENENPRSTISFSQSNRKRKTYENENSEVNVRNPNKAEEQNVNENIENHSQFRGKYGEEKVKEESSESEADNSLFIKNSPEIDNQQTKNVLDTIFEAIFRQQNVREGEERLNQFPQWQKTENKVERLTKESNRLNQNDTNEPSNLKRAENEKEVQVNLENNKSDANTSPLIVENERENAEGRSEFPPRQKTENKLERFTTESNRHNQNETGEHSRLKRAENEKELQENLEIFKSDANTSLLTVENETENAEGRILFPGGRNTENGLHLFRQINVATENYTDKWGNIGNNFNSTSEIAHGAVIHQKTGRLPNSMDIFTNVSNTVQDINRTRLTTVDKGEENQTSSEGNNDSKTDDAFTQVQANDTFLLYPSKYSENGTLQTSGQANIFTFLKKENTETTEDKPQPEEKPYGELDSEMEKRIIQEIQSNINKGDIESKVTDSENMSNQEGSTNPQKSSEKIHHLETNSNTTNAQVIAGTTYLLGNTDDDANFKVDTLTDNAKSENTTHLVEESNYTSNFSTETDDGKRAKIIEEIQRNLLINPIALNKNDNVDKENADEHSGTSVAINVTEKTNITSHQQISDGKPQESLQNKQNKAVASKENSNIDNTDGIYFEELTGNLQKDIRKLEKDLNVSEKNEDDAVEKSVDSSYTVGVMKTEKPLNETQSEIDDNREQNADERPTSQRNIMKIENSNINQTDVIGDTFAGPHSKNKYQRNYQDYMNEDTEKGVLSKEVNSSTDRLDIKNEGNSERKGETNNYKTHESFITTLLQSSPLIMKHVNKS